MHVTMGQSLFRPHSLLGVQVGTHTWDDEVVWASLRALQGHRIVRRSISVGNAGQGLLESLPLRVGGEGPSWAGFLTLPQGCAEPCESLRSVMLMLCLFKMMIVCITWIFC